MLKKLFGGKKDEFFIQLDESKDAKAPQPKAEPKPEAAPAPVAVEAPPAEAPQPAPAQSKKTSIKKESKKAKAEPAKEAAPVPAAPAPKPQPTQVEFATKYLITDSLARRQPGPSLNKFKEMARTLKTR